MTERMLFWSKIAIAVWALFCAAGLVYMAFDIATAATPRWSDHTLNGALIAVTWSFILEWRNPETWRLPVIVLQAAAAALLAACAWLYFTGTA